MARIAISGEPQQAFTGSSRARLSVNYVAARSAIAACSRVDECKSWADKAAALASYARQSKDESLRSMAERIQARAVRRCGELLKQVPSGQGSRNQHGELRAGGVTRQKAARDSGLSERQKVTALRVAKVPEVKFHSLVEGEHPPTIPQLAALGTESRAQVLDSRAQAGRARRLFATIRKFCEETSPIELAKAFGSEESKPIGQFVEGLKLWLDQLRSNLPGAPIRHPPRGARHPCRSAPGRAAPQPKKSQRNEQFHERQSTGAVYAPLKRA